MFSLFSRLFFTFPDDKLLLQFLGFVLIDGISGCLCCLCTRLHFSRLFLVPRPSSQASSSQAGRHSLCQYFSRLLLSIFPDHLCGCSHHDLIHTALRWILLLIPFFFTNWDYRYHLRKFILFVCLSLLSSSEMLPECNVELLIWPTQGQ